MTLSLRQVRPILRARWRRVLLTWILVFGAGLALSLLAPARYDATSAVVVDMNGPDPIGGPAAFRPPGTVSSYLATQVEILKSEEVALGAVRRLGLDRQAVWQDRWRESTRGAGSFEAWLAGVLSRNLDVKPARDSNVLILTYSAPDPDFAARVANALVASYIAATLQMRVVPAGQYNSFFAERAKPLRDALETARVRLSAYEKEHGVAVGEEPDVESARLAELSTQLVTLQQTASEAANLRRLAGSAPNDVREIRSDPEVAALTAELVRQQGRLADLKTDFGERHHSVIQARQSLGDLNRRLEAAMRRAAESLSVPVRVNEARLAELRAAIERQRALVLTRKARRDAAASLLRDVDNAQKAYDAVLQRASQTALESANTTQTTISVLKAATPPLWSPRTLVRNLALAGLVGLLLGIARALLAELRDRRLRAWQDISGELGQPMLLTLPDGTARRGARSEQTVQRLVRGQAWLPAPKGASRA